WSSDVCSSDLTGALRQLRGHGIPSFARCNASASRRPYGEDSARKEWTNASQDREATQVHGCRAGAQAGGQEDADPSERERAREIRQQLQGKAEELTLSAPVAHANG